jgi:hypothetical protein
VARPTQRRELATHWQLLTEREMFPPRSVHVDGLKLTFDVDGTPTPVVAYDIDIDTGDSASDHGRHDDDVELLSTAGVIAVVLDGGILGNWIAATGGPDSDPAAAETASVEAQLGVGQISGRLLAVGRDRRRAARPLPSIALVIGKADKYAEAVGGAGGALPVARLRRLVPACFDRSLLTMVSMAGIRHSSAEGITPWGVLAPFAFGVLIQLGVERIAARSSLNRATGTANVVWRQNELINIRHRADLLEAELSGCQFFRGDDRVPPGDVAGRAGR